MTTLTLADSGSSVSLETGDELIVELKETPGTGFRWKIAHDAAPVLTARGSRYDAPGTQPGAAGCVRLTFAASAAGRAHLALICVRTWEQDDHACARFELDVIVTSD